MAGKDTLFYVLECAVEGCDAEFYINDVPIVLRGEAHGKYYGGQCNQHLIDGINEIEIIINPGPTPGEALKGQDGVRRRLAPDKEAKAGAILAVYPYGAVVRGPERKPLMSAHWTATEDTPEFFPKVVTGITDLGPLFGQWDWEKSEAVQLDDPTLEEIEELVAKLHQSLLTGDPELYIKTSQARFKNTERAYALKPGKKEDLVRLGTRSDSRQHWWGLEPLNPPDFDFRLCGRNRLVEIVNKDWEPPLKELADDEDGVSTYPMLLGKKDGDLEILL